jgi:hypothetical protein
MFPVKLGLSISAQCICWKIQMTGLATQCNNDQNFILKMRHLSGLASLIGDEISGAFNK